MIKMEKSICVCPHCGEEMDCYTHYCEECGESVAVPVELGEKLVKKMIPLEEYQKECCDDGNCGCYCHKITVRP